MPRHLPLEAHGCRCCLRLVAGLRWHPWHLPAAAAPLQCRERQSQVQPSQRPAADGRQRLPRPVRLPAGMGAHKAKASRRHSLGAALPCSALLQIETTIKRHTRCRVSGGRAAVTRAHRCQRDLPATGRQHCVLRRHAALLQCSQRRKLCVELLLQGRQVAQRTHHEACSRAAHSEGSSASYRDSRMERRQGRPGPKDTNRRRCCVLWHTQKKKKKKM